MSKCKGCKIEGFAGPKMMAGENPIEYLVEYSERIEEGQPLLFEHEYSHYCFPCFCIQTLTCVQCWDVVDALYVDERCKSGTYVCRACVVKTRANHKWVCYSNGCMTPGEIAQEEFEILQSHGEIP
tara:strand:+ start:24 stop:401 length:378 start_codon:yes stop_codon:yes gene_type:complete